MRSFHHQLAAALLILFNGGAYGHVARRDAGDAALCRRHKAACQTGIKASQSKSTRTHLGLTHTPLGTMGGASITHTHKGGDRAHLHALHALT